MAAFMGQGSKTISVPFRATREGSATENSVYKDVAVGGGDSVYTVYAPCGAAGSAMYDIESKQYRVGPVEGIGQVTKPHCWLMYAPPIVIHGDYMSVKQGMMHVNMVHRTSNFTPPVTTNLVLSSLGNIG